MSVGLYLRGFCGFALQPVPCAKLLLVPFGPEAFPKGRRRAFVLLAALSIGFSLCYPLSAWWNMGLAEDTNLDDNLFMLLAIVGVTALFMGIAPDTQVVFLTDSEAYAVEAFSVKALHCVL